MAKESEDKEKATKPTSMSASVSRWLDDLIAAQDRRDEAAKRFQEEASRSQVRLMAATKIACTMVEMGTHTWADVNFHATKQVAVLEEAVHFWFEDEDDQRDEPDESWENE